MGENAGFRGEAERAVAVSHFNDEGIAGGVEFDAAGLAEFSCGRGAAEDGCVLARLTKEVAEEERGTDNGEDAIEESGRHRSGSGGLCPSQGRLDSGRGAPTGSLFCRAVIAAGWARRAVLVR